MSLRGSLADMGIVDLLQFPYAGRRTGLLIVAGEGTEATLHYDGGNLVHAQMGASEGIDVLVELVGWTEGEFEFQAGSPLASAPSIEVDVHRAIMMALKIRDERTLAQQSEPGTSPSPFEPAGELIRSLVADNDRVHHAALLDSDGSPLAAAAATEGDSEALAHLVEALAGFCFEPRRPGLRRLFVEDESGTTVVAAVEPARWLVVANDTAATLGSVSLVVTRAAAALNELEE